MLPVSAISRQLATNLVLLQCLLILQVRGSSTGDADELVMLRAEVSMLREATKEFDGTSLAVQLAEARATVQMLEFNVRRLESELDGGAASLSTDGQPAAASSSQQSCEAGSDTACQAALRDAEARIQLQQEQLDQKTVEAESLSRELDVVKADSARAKASQQELEATIKRLMNENVDHPSLSAEGRSIPANVPLEGEAPQNRSQAIDAPTNFGIDSSMLLDKADLHTENFSTVVQQLTADPFGESQEVLLTGRQTPCSCNCEELQHDLASARAEMELAAAEAAAFEQAQALPAGELGSEIVTEWDNAVEVAKTKSRMFWHMMEQLMEQALLELGLDGGAAAARRITVALALSISLLLFLSCCCCFCGGSAI